MSIIWETPQLLWNTLDAEFRFTLDVCAIPENAKCNKFFTPEINGLFQDWSNDTFWMNPPYGRGQDVYSWVEKAYSSAMQGTVGVALLPSSTDTKWFHEFCLRSDEIRFVKDRIWFVLDGHACRANHGSMVVVFRQHVSGLKISSMPNFSPKHDRETRQLKLFGERR